MRTDNIFGVRPLAAAVCIGSLLPMLPGASLGSGTCGSAASKLCGADSGSKQPHSRACLCRQLRDPEERTAMGQAAAERARDFSVEAIADQYLADFHELKA